MTKIACTRSLLGNIACHQEQACVLGQASDSQKGATAPCRLLPRSLWPRKIARTHQQGLTANGVSSGRPSAARNADIVSSNARKCAVVAPPSLICGSAAPVNSVHKIPLATRGDQSSLTSNSSISQLISNPPSLSSKEYVRFIVRPSSLKSSG